MTVNLSNAHGARDVRLRKLGDGEGGRETVQKIDRYDAEVQLADEVLQRVHDLIKDVAEVARPGAHRCDCEDK